MHASQLQAVLALAPEQHCSAEGGRSSLPITGKHFYHRQPMYFSRLQVGSVTLAGLVHRLQVSIVSALRADFSELLVSSFSSNSSYQSATGEQ